MMRARKRRTSFRCGHATLPVSASVASEALSAPPGEATGGARAWLAAAAAAAESEDGAHHQAAMTAARRVNDVGIPGASADDAPKAFDQHPER